MFGLFRERGLRDAASQMMAQLADVEARYGLINVRDMMEGVARDLPANRFKVQHEHAVVIRPSDETPFDFMLAYKPAAGKCEVDVVRGLDKFNGFYMASSDGGQTRWMAYTSAQSARPSRDAIALVQHLAEQYGVADSDRVAAEWHAMQRGS